MDDPPIEKKKFDKEKILLFFSIALNIALIIFLIYNNNPSSPQEFNLIDPSIAEMDLNHFLDTQDSLSVSYKDLRKEVEPIFQNARGKYSFYFEDLSSGAWTGIGEREEYVSASLMKVIVMISILKKVEQEELTLGQEIMLEEKDINLNSGTLGLKGPGYKITIQELLYSMIIDSDNTAINALKRYLTASEVREAVLATGQPMINISDKEAKISPKDYMNVFRSLYFSSYLRRPSSQFALSLMSETHFNSGIPAGVPKNIKVSHKIGTWIQENSFHDCGIVYLPKKPYLICIMSKSTTETEANRVIKEVSEIVYDYVN